MGNIIPNDRLIDLIYRGATDTTALRDALQSLANEFHCRGGTLVSFDNRMPGVRILLTVGAWNDDVNRKYQEVAALDPAPAAFARLPPGSVSTTDRVLNRDVLRNGAFVNDFYRRAGFQESIGATLFADQSRFALMGLVRGEDRSAFEDWEIEGVKGFVPHLARALQLRRAFGELEAKTAGLQEVIERLKAGVVMLGAQGTAFFANRAARAVFARGDALTLSRAGRPVALQPTARRKLDKLIFATCGGGAGGILAIPAAQAGRAYPCLVAPLAPNIHGWFEQSFAEPGALMLIHDPRSFPRQAEDVLQAALGLRPRAAKLVAALAADDNLQSYAQRTGITIHTARFHLHAALIQTQTRRQAELMRLVIRVLRDLALREET